MFLQKDILSEKIDFLDLLISHPKINVNAIYTSVNIDEYEILKKSALSIVIEEEKESFFKTLIKHSEIDYNFRAINITDKTKTYTHILHMAVDKRNTSMVKCLLSCSEIDVNIKSLEETNEDDFCDTIEETALLKAINNDDIEIIGLLLSHPKIDLNFCYKKTHLTQKEFFIEKKLL